MNRRQKLVQQQFLNNEKAVIKRLEQVYGVALKDIDGKIERLMKRFDPDTGDLPQSVIYQIKYQEMLKAQVEGILKQMQTQQFLTVSDYLNLCYEDGFVGSLFDLHGQDVPLAMPLNQESMVKAVQLDSKISKGLYTRLGEDVDLLKKKITAQVSRSISTGVSFQQTAKQLANYTRIGYNNAVRIARTEGHRIQCSATHDAAQQAKDRGADIVKMWDATLDGKTRESHVAVDGQIREVDEAFSNGLMFPGDPAGGAAEVINCRCAYLQKARRWLDGSFTKVNNFTKQIESFDRPEDYEEFKKGFFSPENKKFMNYAQQMEAKYDKDWNGILDQMTDREYKHYSKLLGNNPLYNTKAPEPVTVKLRELLTGCKTTGEVSTTTQTYFREKVGSKITTVDFGKADLNAAKEMAEMLDRLDDTYESSLTGVRVKYMSNSFAGRTTPTEKSFQRFLATGDPSVLESTMELNENLFRSKKSILADFNNQHRSRYGNTAHGAWVDEKYAAVSTLVHEYGHTICPGKANEIYQSQTGNFNPGYMSFRRQYNVYMRGLRDKQREISAVRDSFAGQPDGLRLGLEAAKDLQTEYDAVCISHYSKESVGEFIAEAFCDATLNGNAKPASIKVLESIKKIYGKGE
jgi:hypothetical protein